MREMGGEEPIGEEEGESKEAWRCDAVAVMRERESPRDPRDVPRLEVVEARASTALGKANGKQKRGTAVRVRGHGREDERRRVRIETSHASRG